MKILLFLAFMSASLVAIGQSSSKATTDSALFVNRTNDFDISGSGSAEEWKKTSWQPVTQRSRQELSASGWKLKDTDKKTINYSTRFKMLYSERGIYCLYECEDSIITATLKGDFLNLFTEDVVEAFFRPDTSALYYFEYELSPLNYELPILILNNDGRTGAWQAWKYSDRNKIIHRVNVPAPKNGRRFTWTAEFFIPFGILSGMKNVPPSSGTRWRANFYRIDYDGATAFSSWRPTRRGFHDYERFGWIEFR